MMAGAVQSNGACMVYIYSMGHRVPLQVRRKTMSSSICLSGSYAERKGTTTTMKTKRRRKKEEEAYKKSKANPCVQMEAKKYQSAYKTQTRYSFSFRTRVIHTRCRFFSLFLMICPYVNIIIIKYDD